MAGTCIRGINITLTLNLQHSTYKISTSLAKLKISQKKKQHLEVRNFILFIILCPWYNIIYAHTWHYDQIHCVYLYPKAQSCEFEYESSITLRFSNDLSSALQE